MIEFVNAKINVGLQVERRRPDGYHDLSTVFVPVGRRSGCAGEPGGLCDILEITASDHDSMIVTGADFQAAPEDNLVWKALMLFRQASGITSPYAVTLEKHLPSGAGMGGGSADAAFALRMLNDLNEGCLPASQLHSLARRLGADVPFFLMNEPCYATGIGEVLTPVDIPALEGKWIAVIKPAEGISTAQAFRHVTPRPSAVNLCEAVQLPVNQWKSRIVNDFEQSMFSIHPELISLKQYLYEHGALYASMTGSGSAFYGIFDDEEQARHAAADCNVSFSAIASM